MVLDYIGVVSYHKSMNKAEQIRAACEKFRNLSMDATNARERGESTPEHIAARDTARAELMTLLSDLGFVRAWDDADGRRLRNGEAYAAKKIGHVKLTAGLGGLAATAWFTAAATVSVAAKQNAIRARVASDERNY